MKDRNVVNQPINCPDYQKEKNFITNTITTKEIKTRLISVNRTPEKKGEIYLFMRNDLNKNLCLLIFRNQREEQ